MSRPKKHKYTSPRVFSTILANIKNSSRCPTVDKVCYKTAAEAILGCLTAEKHCLTLKHYKCQCGYFHTATEEM